MILTKECRISKFSGFYRKSDTNNTIKILVGNDTFCVNEMILSWWSEEYVKLLEQDEPTIFLQDFIGHSKEVDECLALLHGLEVDVSLDNVIVLAKFADKFKIKELNEQIECWFGDSINQENLLNIIQTISNIHELNSSFINNLTGVIRQYLLKFLTVCVDIITKKTIEINTFMLDLLLDEDTLFSTFLPVILSQLEREDDYKILLSKLEQLADNKPSLLLQNEKHLQKFTDSISDLEDCDPYIWKRAMNFSKCLLRYASHTLIVTKGMPTFQSWRNFKKEDVKMLSDNEIVSDYHYTVILLDWIEHQNPGEDDILELFYYVHDYFLWWINKYNRSFITSKYSIPYIGKEPICRYKTQCFGNIVSRTSPVTGCALLEYLAGNSTVNLSEECYVKGCDVWPYHGVTVKFTTNLDGDRLHLNPIDVHPDKSCNFHNHLDTHHYLNWYLRDRDYNNLYPLFTKSYTELKEFLVKKRDEVFVICCSLTEK